ncbi:ATP-binding protein [Alteromonas macleodii]|uniref:DNA mismatch repair protein n=1 Tax=Alteromonas macleodii TaxID=28108 RepID=A0A6T9XZL5_ALTMA|nr:ATP-binding protein [Alteromonas macleodii]CAB9492898.1 DNA mismatch repair protein [Alteromonas macleodii]
MEELIKVEVKKDHLDKVSRAPVLTALTELVWNAFDADADLVQVTIDRNDFGLQAIHVKDDGMGIEHKDSKVLFSSLGGSWKGLKNVSPKGRFLHGKEGQGRFKSFAIGRIVEWKTSFFDGQETLSYTMKGKADNKGVFYPTPPKVSGSKSTGTTVSIYEPHKEFTSISKERLLEHFSSVFAIYLSQYKSINLYVDGELVDPESQIEHKTNITLDTVIFDNIEYPYELQIIEWKCNTANEIQLCNNNGFPLLPYEKAIRGTGDFSYTAYLKSEHISKLNTVGTLGLGDLEPSLSKPIEAATSALKNHFMLRRIELSADKIEKWKREDVYPYPNVLSGPIEEAERQVFDILALNISEQIPEFERSDIKLKKFQFRLLKQIVGSNPDDLHIILTEVLNLTKGKQSELAELLKEASLSSIISASKVVSDRLKFVTGLEEIIFHPEKKKVLKERTQLHKILAENTWVFGDEFSLTVNDQSLSEVLRVHLNKKRVDIQLDKPVKRIDGRVGIVDLMLTRSIGKNHSDEREHLVVELKAPKVKIGQDEITQIESYAFAVAEDERFKHLKTKWNFWIISNDLDAYAERRLKQDNTSKGIIYDADGITIWVKTWGELIQECKHRLEFVREQLDISIDKSDGLKYLQDSYYEYTKDVVLTHGDEEVEA